MPKIGDSLRKNLDMSNYTPLDSPTTPNSNVFTQESVRRDVFLRCPVPPQGSTSPDDLRQYYLNGVIPQYRVFVK